MKPLVSYTSACALIVCSLCNTTRTTFVVACLACMYSYSLFLMLVSYEQHNVLVRSVCNHNNSGHECHTYDVRKENNNKLEKHHQEI